MGLIRRGLAKARVIDGYSLMELIIVIILATVAMPGIVGMYTTTMVNSQKAELMTMSDMLAREQMEIILADKAGTGAGFGYANINTAKYASVNPTGYFASFARTVTITTLNPGGLYESKMIVVTVSHTKIPSVVLTGLIFNHAGI